MQHHVMLSWQKRPSGDLPILPRANESSLQLLMAHLIPQTSSLKPDSPKATEDKLTMLRKKTQATKANAAPFPAVDTAAEDAAASRASREAAVGVKLQRTSIGGPVDDDTPVKVARRADAALPLLPHVSPCCLKHGAPPPQPPPTAFNTAALPSHRHVSSHMALNTRRFRCCISK